MRRMISAAMMVVPDPPLGRRSRAGDYQSRFERPHN
jgi:hypothetical protein